MTESGRLQMRDERHGDGTVETLTATQSAEVGAGDGFVIETPGGGGFGRPNE